MGSIGHACIGVPATSARIPLFSKLLAHFSLPRVRKSVRAPSPRVFEKRQEEYVAVVFGLPCGLSVATDGIWLVRLPNSWNFRIDFVLASVAAVVVVIVVAVVVDVVVLALSYLLRIQRVWTAVPTTRLHPRRKWVISVPTRRRPRREECGIYCRSDRWNGVSRWQEHKNALRFLGIPRVGWLLGEWRESGRVTRSDFGVRKSFPGGRNTRQWGDAASLTRSNSVLSARINASDNKCFIGYGDASKNHGSDGDALSLRHWTSLNCSFPIFIFAVGG